MADGRDQRTSGTAGLTPLDPGDAGRHGLYRQFGFEPFSTPDRFMERFNGRIRGWADPLVCARPPGRPWLRRR